MRALLMTVLLSQAPAAHLAPVRVEIGEHRFVTVPGMQRVAVGGSDVCDVKTVGNDRLEIIGAARGRTTLLIWDKHDRRFELEVTVARWVPSR